MPLVLWAVIMLIIAAALPLFAVLRYGLWPGFWYMFSPFNEHSLTRLLLPAAMFLTACLGVAVLVQFTIELARLVRRRQ